jgi:hypothetical protein
MWSPIAGSKIFITGRRHIESMQAQSTLIQTTGNRAAVPEMKAFTTPKPSAPHLELEKP